LLCCFVAFAALSCLFALALDAGFFKEAPAAYLADNSFLLYFPGETPQQAFKAFPFAKSYFRHKKSTPFLLFVAAALLGSIEATDE